MMSQNMSKHVTCETSCTLAASKLLPGSVALSELTYGTPGTSESQVDIVDIWYSVDIMLVCWYNIDIVCSERQMFTTLSSFRHFLISTLHCWRPRNSSMCSHEDQESQAPQRQSLETKFLKTWEIITSCTNCTSCQLCATKDLFLSSFWCTIPGKMNEYEWIWTNSIWEDVKRIFLLVKLLHSTSHTTLGSTMDLPAAT